MHLPSGQSCASPQWKSERLSSQRWESSTFTADDSYTDFHSGWDNHCHRLCLFRYVYNVHDTRYAWGVYAPQIYSSQIVTGRLDHPTGP